MAPRWHNLTDAQQAYWRAKGSTRATFDQRAALREYLDRFTYLPIGNGKRPLSPSNNKGLCNCDGVPE